jgi:hypothetical protein
MATSTVKNRPRVAIATHRIASPPTRRQRATSRTASAGKLNRPAGPHCNATAEPTPTAMASQSSSMEPRSSLLVTWESARLRIASAISEIGKSRTTMPKSALSISAAPGA